MRIRVAIGGVSALVLAVLGFWLLSGDRGARREAAELHDAARRPGRPAAPLEGVDPVAPETHERERVGGDAPPDEDTFLPPGVQAPASWPGTCSLFGRLLDEDGRPVSGPTVWLTDGSGQRHDVELESGRYRAVGLAPGRWWIESRGGVYLAVRESVELHRTDAALEVDLVFHPKLIVAVNVLASTGGSFWEGLSETELLFGVEPQVIATRELVQGPDEIETKNLASFRAAERQGRALADPLLGVLEVEAEPPLIAQLLLGTLTVAAQTLEPGMDQLTFTVDPRAVIELLVTLRFRVLDAAGTPTDAASVMIEGGGENTFGKLLTDGVFERDGLYPGSCQIMIQAPGHNMIRRTVALRPGLVDLGDLRLEPALSLHGLVVDPRGDALIFAEEGTLRSDVHLELGRRDPTTGVFAIDPSLLLMIDASGEFRLPLEAGTYLLRARGREWLSRNVLVTVPGDPVVLTVFPPSVVVLKLDTGDWDGWTFILLDEQGHLAATGRFEGGAPQRLDLPPGSYALTLTDTAGLPRQEVPFELGQEELVINLAL